MNYISSGSCPTYKINTDLYTVLDLSLTANSKWIKRNAIVGEGIFPCI